MVTVMTAISRFEGGEGDLDGESEGTAQHERMMIGKVERDMGPMAWMTVTAVL